MSSGGGLGRRLRAVWYASPLHDWRITGDTPDDLAVPLADPWPGDVEAGREILEGAFPIEGQLVHVGGDPWSAEGLTEGALCTLHRFDWLRDQLDPTLR